MSEREKNEKSTVRPMKRTRKKVCAFCADRAEFIDYKDVAKLRKCMTERYKILPRQSNRLLRISSERAYNSYQEGKTGSSYSLRF